MVGREVCTWRAARSGIRSSVPGSSRSRSRLARRRVAPRQPRPGHLAWRRREGTVEGRGPPVDEIYLVGGPLQAFRERRRRRRGDRLPAESDQGLASKVPGGHGAVHRDVRSLIGPYPYSKFALVENFWETGYGMPSFTLLGPSINPVPVHHHLVYPHEILHNWWGNGVFVDYATGNWSEGLTPTSPITSSRSSAAGATSTGGRRCRSTATTSKPGATSRSRSSARARAQQPEAVGTARRSWASTCCAGGWATTGSREVSSGASIANSAASRRRLPTSGRRPRPWRGVARRVLRRWVARTARLHSRSAVSR